jgi:hypothetical protein
MESVGDASMPGPLIFGPRFTGASHGLSSEARRDTQISAPPNPPARVDTKYRLSSSGDNAAFISFADELTGAPRFTGSDHSELANDIAWIPGTVVLDSGLQASRTAKGTRDRDARVTDLMRSPLFPIVRWLRTTGTMIIHVGRFMA